MHSRLSQVQRRYSEGMTTQTDLEQQKQAAEEQVQQLQKEKEGLASESKGLKAKADSLEAKMASLESKNTQLIDRINKAEKENSALDEKQRQTLQTVRDREKELKQAAADWQRLNKKHDQCVANNARLCALGDELIKKYQNKGVMGALLEKEPITQIKKVELEKIAQEYRDKIDQQKIEAPKGKSK